MSDVRSSNGVPVLSDFASGSGTPVIIDTTTGIAYCVKDGDIVVPLSGNISSSSSTVSVNQTIAADSSAVVVRKLLIASGKKLTIGLGARLRIL